MFKSINYIDDFIVFVNLLNKNTEINFHNLIIKNYIHRIKIFFERIKYLL